MVRPAWKVRLGSARLDANATTVVSPSLASRQLACFPIVVDDLVLVSDSCTVRAYERRSGSPVFVYDLARELPQEKLTSLQVQVPAPAELRFTLSATPDAVFARLGRQKLGPREGGGPNSYLACLELRPGHRKPGGGRWLIPSESKPGEVSAFEGTPVVRDGLVFVAHSRFKGAHTLTSLVCYRAEDGAGQWRQEVCVTAEFKLDASPRYRHHLLTLAGPNLIYCSHAGTIVAVEAVTGRLAWALRYPSQHSGSSGEGISCRDLGACCYHADRVYVAPSDSNTLYCLDAETGRTLWSRASLNPVHLLGVTSGRLVFSTEDGMRALDAQTGNDRTGWAQPDEGRLPSYGRALLAGGWVFWPTQDAKFPVRAVNAEDGTQEREGDAFTPTELKRILPGNLAYAHGSLVVAGATEMAVYVAPAESSPRPERRK
jgi:outer membrane protein assembly factor BamB